MLVLSLWVTSGFLDQMLNDNRRLTVDYINVRRPRPACSKPVLTIAGLLQIFVHNIGGHDRVNEMAEASLRFHYKWRPRSP
jgi:hypothetical protein